MIRSSALLTVTAMAMLVAGVFSASLGLIYASIAVSILAALTLGVGVLLRRRELFGGAAAGDIRPGRAAADVAGARPAVIPSAGIQAAGTGTAGAAQEAGARQAADDRPRTDRGATGDDGGEKDGDLAEGPRKAASGAGPGAGRWPGSIAAKGASVTGRRGGEHAAAHAVGRGRSARPAPGTGQSARDPAAQAPAPGEPAGGDPARTERDRAGRAAWADRAGQDQERDRTRGGTGARTGTLPRRPTVTRPRQGASPPPGEPAAMGHRSGTRQPPHHRPRRSGCPRPMSGPPGPGATWPAADVRTPRPRTTTSGTGSAKNSPAAGAGPPSGRPGQPPRDRGRWGPVPLPSTALPTRRTASRRRPGHRRGTGRRNPRPGTARPRGRPTRRPVTNRPSWPAAGESGWDRMVPPYVDDLTRPKRDREPAETGSGDAPGRRRRSGRGRGRGRGGHARPGCRRCLERMVQAPRHPSGRTGRERRPRPS